MNDVSLAKLPVWAQWLYVVARTWPSAVPVVLVAVVAGGLWLSGTAFAIILPWSLFIAAVVCWYAARARYREAEHEYRQLMQEWSKVMAERNALLQRYEGDIIHSRAVRWNKVTGQIYLNPEFDPFLRLAREDGVTSIRR